MTGSIFSAPPMDQRLLLAEEILSTMPSDCFRRFHTPVAINSQTQTVANASSGLTFRRWARQLLKSDAKA